MIACKLLTLQPFSVLTPVPYQYVRGTFSIVRHAIYNTEYLGARVKEFCAY